MKKPALPNQSQWVSIFFFFCFGWIAFQSFLLAKPFLPGLLGAAMLGLAFSPLYQKVLKWVRRPNAAASILTGGIFLGTVLPLAGLGWMAVNEAEVLRPTVADFIANYNTPVYFQGLLSPLFNYFAGFHIDLKSLVLDLAAKISARMSTGGAELAGHLIVMLFNGLVLMLTLFFVFRDGKKGAEKVLAVLPMSPENKADILKRVYGTFRAVVVGVFVTALTEGLLDMAGFFISGVPLAVLFGVAVAIFSLLGASVLITIPAAFWVMNHDTGWGVFLLIWGILVSVVSDNVLKPALIGSQAKMPFLLMLFSTLGGIKLYGLMGLFLGPMVITAFLTFWSIYRRDHEDIKTK